MSSPEDKRLQTSSYHIHAHTLPHKVAHGGHFRTTTFSHSDFKVGLICKCEQAKNTSLKDSRR